MGDYSEEEDHDLYFDVCEERSSESDWSVDCSDDCSSSSSPLNDILDILGHNIWTKYPESVRERRSQFLRITGLRLDQSLIEKEETWPSFDDENEVDTDRITRDSGTVLRGSSDWCSSIESFESSGSIQGVDLLIPSTNGLWGDRFRTRSRDSNDGVVFTIDEFVQAKTQTRIHELGLNRSGSRSIEDLRRLVGSSPLVQPFLHGAKLDHLKEPFIAKQKTKISWLRKLGVGSCVTAGSVNICSKLDDLEITEGMKMRKVRSTARKKKYKELSSVYAGQEFLAHEGAIASMKFSADGQYLASAGEDAIVRIWKVTEEERSEKIDILDLDPSCLYFAINQSSELASLNMDKEHVNKLKRIGRQADSCCVILPSRVFRILEKPWQELHGHTAEILDLAWSQKGYLLSSSIDKTVRLWEVGCNECKGVFHHNNFVTSINFNPLDEDRFISGSIDGKVRIWEVRRGQVVDYIDSKEIVSAVSYQSDGKGVLVGTMSGNCCFYSIEDDHLQLDAQVCLHSGKKTPGKRITGFQIPPGDPSKIMVTTADSTVRILSGVDVIFKLRGIRSSGSHKFASFTSDGKHIISASDDSNVCIWNYATQDKLSSRPKSILPCESFFSYNASIAIPWCGIRSTADGPPACLDDRQGTCTETGQQMKNHNSLDDYFDQKLPMTSSPDCFSMGKGFLLELLPKGSATWPEEKLSDSGPVLVSPAICKSEYKFLRSAVTDSPHMWGLVIVTAGSDGQIRTYHNYGLPMRS